MNTDITKKYPIRFASNLKIIWQRINNIISKKTKVAVVIILGGIFCSGLVVVTAPKHMPEKIIEKSRAISTMGVQVDTLSPNLSLFGRVSTPRKAHLAAAIQADVLSVKVADGQEVLKGALLIQLDDRDAQLEVMQQQATLNDANAQLAILKSRHVSDKKMLIHHQDLFQMAKNKFTRYQKLKNDKMISDAVYDEASSLVKQQAISLELQLNTVKNFSHELSKAHANVEHKLVNLKKAQLNLERTQITAPFTGLVSGLTVAPGDRVNSGTVLVGLIDTKQMEVRGTIASKYIGKLRNKMDAGLKISAWATIDNKKIELELKQLSAEVGKGHSGVQGIFNIVDNSEAVTLGRVVNLSLTLPSISDVVAVPVQSVYDNERIFIVENNRLRGVVVDVVGERLDQSGKYELLISSQELHDGQQLMTSQLSQAITGLKVKQLGINSESIAADNAIASKSTKETI